MCECSTGGIHYTESWHTDTHRAQLKCYKYREQRETAEVGLQKRPNWKKLSFDKNIHKFTFCSVYGWALRLWFHCSPVSSSKQNKLLKEQFVPVLSHRGWRKKEFRFHKILFNLFQPRLPPFYSSDKVVFVQITAFQHMFLKKFTVLYRLHLCNKGKKTKWRKKDKFKLKHSIYIVTKQSLWFPTVSVTAVDDLLQSSISWSTNKNAKSEQNC